MPTLPFSRSLCLAVLVTAAACAPAAEEETESLSAAAVATPSVKAPRADGITFGRATQDRLTEVPIGKSNFDKAKVLLSVKLDDPSPAEELLLRAELTLSTCGDKDISGDASDGEKNPCSTPDLKRSPYTYSPHMAAVFVVGDAADDTKGPRLGGVHDMSCNHREHHCTIAIDQTRVKGPTAAKAKFVNLVVSADDPRARSFDLMIVEQSHAALSVTRLGAKANAPVAQKQTSDSLKKGDIDIDRESGDGGPLGVDPKQHHPIYRVKLEGLKPGDIIDADAKLVAKVHNGPAACDGYFSQEILITKEPDETGTKRPGDEWLTQVNGSNCTDHAGECVFQKSGAVQLGKDAPSTMYVNLIATAGRTCVPPGYTWEVRSGGSLDVVVRR